MHLWQGVWMLTEVSCNANGSLCLLPCVSHLVFAVWDARQKLLSVIFLDVNHRRSRS